MKPPIRVVKVGGSLFDFAGLPVALDDWLARQGNALPILVAGGGDLADAIRVASQRFRLDPVSAHWICVDAMTTSARLLAALLPAAEFLNRYEDVQTRLQRHRSAALVFAAGNFLRRIEPRLAGPKLPEDWTVTSDSIAARLAVALDASELVLMKSCDLGEVRTVRDAAQAGLVDEFFPLAAADLPAIRWVNLRSAGAAERILNRS